MATLRPGVAYFPSPSEGDAVPREWKESIRVWARGRRRVVARYSAADGPDALRDAIARARTDGATLVIPALPLSNESAAMLLDLKESGVDYHIVEMPPPMELTRWAMDALEEQRRVRHGELTRNGIRSAKRRGVAFGTPANLTDEAKRRGVEVRQERARDDERNKSAAQLCAIYVADGMSLSWIADRLNEMKLTTRRGAPWTKSNLHRVWQKYGRTYYEAIERAMDERSIASRRTGSQHKRAPAGGTRARASNKRR